MKDFSYLIGANFSDQKWVAALQPIRAAENISLGTELLVKRDLQLGSMAHSILPDYYPKTVTACLSRKDFCFCPTRERKNLT